MPVWFSCGRVKLAGCRAAGLYLVVKNGEYIKNRRNLSTSAWLVLLFSAQLIDSVHVHQC